jgi:N-methylhydantoinase A
MAADVATLRRPSPPPRRRGDRCRAASRHRYWVGIDIGGTFADYVVYDEQGERLAVYKAPAPASKRADHVLAGLGALMKRESIEGGDVVFFGHGTTVATNAVLTGEPVPLGLLTTRGFGDLLVIRRQTRRDTFDYYADFPPPLVPRDAVVELGERINADGEVVDPLDPAEVERALEGLAARGVRSVAAVLLHSYANPSHEREIGRIAGAKFPTMLTSLSCDLVPEFREYERTSTTVLNAFVRPPVTAYLSGIEAGLRDLGIGAPVLVMQSNGGIMSSETAKRQPVALVRSGPAAGVAGAAFVARQAGERRVITFDIGGTSTDVSVFDGERPATIKDWDVHTFPVKWSALDIRSIGAGGGSVAWLDSGLLKVGPQSMGAEPGPACYGRGGREATVTDAHVVLGRIGPDAVLGETLRIDSRRAWDVMRALGRRLNRSPQAAAEGVLEIVNAAIAQEVHYICTERGDAPRDYTLVAYGGAGPLHASEVARELHVRRVLVPGRPGLLCAMGVLASAPAADFAMTRLLDLRSADESCARALRTLFEALGGRARRWMDEQRIPHRGARLRYGLDMRYRGQNYELPVDLPSRRWTTAELIERFHRRHEQAYGYRSAAALVQCVNARLSVALAVDHPPLRIPVETAGRLRPRETRSAYMGRGHGTVRCPVYRRDDLPRRAAFRGPAIVEQMDATTVVLPGQRARLDRWGNLVLEFEGARR